jgi:predicted Zn finger-like uncharacterized protein
MDVRCEHCHTEYELEDAKISDLGTEVQCSDCGHSFTVRRGSPARPAATPVSAPGPEWTIETSLGRSHRLHDLTTLHKWIIERRVSRQDRISQDGQNWRYLSDLPELTPFFEIVDSAERARRADTPGPMPLPFTAPVLLQPSAIPSVAPEEIAAQVPRRALTPTLGQPSIPPRAAALGAVPEAAEQGETELVALAAGRRRSYLKILAALLVATVVAYIGILWQNHRLRVQSQSAASMPADGTPSSAAGLANAPPTESEQAGPGRDDDDNAAHGPVIEPLTGPSDGIPLLGQAEVAPRAPRAQVTHKPKRETTASPRHAAATSSKHVGHQSLTAQGYVALHRRLYPLAVALFKRAIVGDPNNPSAIFGLAEAYRSSGQKTEALIIYRRYVNVAPTGPDAAAARLHIRQLGGKKRR